MRPSERPACEGGVRFGYTARHTASGSGTPRVRPRDHQYFSRPVHGPCVSTTAHTTGDPVPTSLTQPETHHAPDPHHPAPDRLLRRVPPGVRNGLRAGARLLGDAGGHARRAP